MMRSYCEEKSTKLSQALTNRKPIASSLGFAMGVEIFVDLDAATGHGVCVCHQMK